MLTMNTRWVDPFAAFRRELDEMLGAVADPRYAERAPRSGVWPAVNLWDGGDALHVESEIPGVRPEDLEIFAVGKELTLKGRRAQPSAPEGAQRRGERWFGDFTRVLALPVEVDAEQIEATLSHGVLKLRLPKAPEARRRSISVRSA